MNYEDLINKIDQIYKLQKEYRHKYEDLKREIYIHLKNGDKAYSTFHSFVYFNEDQTIMCRVNGKVERININEIYAIGF